MNRYEENLILQGKYIPGNLSHFELGLKRAANICAGLGSAGLATGLIISNLTLAGSGLVSGALATGMISKIERVSVERGLSSPSTTS